MGKAVAAGKQEELIVMRSQVWFSQGRHRPRVTAMEG